MEGGGVPTVKHLNKVGDCCGPKVKIKLIWICEKDQGVELSVSG